jgi:WD40 repeat protein
VFTPDGKQLAVAATGALHVWDTATGKQARRFFGDALQWSDSLAVAPGGKLLAVPGSDNAVHLWDAQAGQELRRCQGGHLIRPWKVAFSPDGKIMASTGFNDPLVCLWDVASGKLLHDPLGHRAGVTSVAMAPDGRLAASAGRDGLVLVWDMKTYQLVRRFDAGAAKPLACVAFAPDGRSLAASTAAPGRGERIWVWDMAAKGPPRRLANVRTGINALAYAPDGKTLATGGNGDFVVFWNLTTGESSVRYPLGRAAVITALAYSPDGRWLASLDTFRAVRLWDTAAGKDVRRLQAPSAALNAMAFAPDGNTLATAGGDNTLRLWEPATGQEVLRCNGPGGPLTAVAVSPDGRLLAGAAADGRIRLWEAATAHELATFAGHRLAVRALAFTADGTRLLSGSDDSSSLVWDVSRILEREPVAIKLTANELEQFWTDLADPDARKAHKALTTLAGAPSLTVPLFRQRLAPPPSSDRVGRLLLELGDDDFRTRERAQAELTKMGASVQLALRKALDDRPGAEVRGRLTLLLAKLKGPSSFPAEGLRELRAVQVLERIGNPAARELLTRLAEAGPATRLAREARAALKRLERRTDSRP